MQRGVREHHAQGRVTGGHGGRDRRTGARGEEDDRSLRSAEERGGSRRDPAEDAEALQVTDHDGEGLRGATLPLPQPEHRRLAPGVAHEVEASEALDGHHLAPCERLRGPGQGIHPGPVVREVALPSRPGAPPGQPGTAHLAGVGLGVEAAVEGIAVLLRARRAEPEAGHGRGGPVVGHVTDDGEAGPAVRAVGEGIAVAPVRRVEQLGPAGRAGGQVREHRRLEPAAPVAPADGEVPEAGRVEPTVLEPPDDGPRRGGGAERVQEAAQARPAPLDLQADAPGVVHHPTPQLQTGGEPVHERAEAHPLDRAVDLDPEPVGARPVPPTRHRRAGTRRLRRRRTARSGAQERQQAGGRGRGAHGLAGASRRPGRLPPPPFRVERPRLPPARRATPSTRRHPPRFGTKAGGPAPRGSPCGRRP